MRYYIVAGLMTMLSVPQSIQAPAVTDLIPHVVTARERAVVLQFERDSGYPTGRPGFVVDHKIPLCAGGPDAVTNLHWMALKDAYAKDVFERQLCRDLQDQGYILVKRVKRSDAP